MDALLDIPNVRDIRLASKGLIGLTQHFLQDDVLRGMERLAKKAFERGVDLALHCHANHAEQITPLVGRAVHRLDHGGCGLLQLDIEPRVSIGQPDPHQDRPGPASR